MDIQALFDAAVGPLSGLVLALGVVYLIYRGRLVPEIYFRKVEERADLLEKENTELNDSVKSLIVQNAECNVSIGILKAEVIELRGEVEELKRQPGDAS